jgi:hypothetical protein
VKGLLLGWLSWTLMFFGISFWVYAYNGDWPNFWVVVGGPLFGAGWAFRRYVK